MVVVLMVQVAKAARKVKSFSSVANPCIWVGALA